MLALLGINVNQMVIYIVGFLIVAALIVGGYFYWKHNVTENAQMQFNNQQLQQKIKEDEDFIAQSKILTEQQNAAIADLTQKNNDLNSKLKDLDDYLNSPQASKDDRDSSEVLKQTIDKLRKATSP